MSGVVPNIQFRPLGAGAISLAAASLWAMRNAPGVTDNFTDINRNNLRRPSETTDALD